VYARARTAARASGMGQGVSGNIITSDLIHWSWYMPFGMLTPASWVAMAATRYMHEYGDCADALAQVAVVTRNYAQNNPAAAFYGKPLSLEEYYGSHWICERCASSIAARKPMAAALC